eukprot:CAMPEP_0198587422 /NCGR_PEP_ID=MMETSP1462-20131121/131830_1 /TAXON_ID=1333877 /ORGANISM="Brandtodinium nutriculum, Strain RCC3387" /LENGTH=165 /DNA_ID=CAMNT_0044318901 /DNA_START=78 /DNA_END=571 /DNA_ORIENTATION=+
MDRPPAVPEVFQRLDIKVAFIRGADDKSTHAALTGLVRNARGPQSMREFEQDAQSDEVTLLIPEKSVAHLSPAELAEGTPCTLEVTSVEDVRRHRRVHIRGAETADLQIVAWRVHEIVLGLARAGSLADKDFDLQDSAWDMAMQAFQSKRQGVQEATPDAVPSAA